MERDLGARISGISLCLVRRGPTSTDSCLNRLHKYIWFSDNQSFDSLTEYALNEPRNPEEHFAVQNTVKLPSFRRSGTTGSHRMQAEGKSINIEYTLVPTGQ